VAWWITLRDGIVSVICEEWFWAIMAVVSTLVIFILQQRTENKISRATFVYSISNDFAANDRILKVYQWLEKCRRENLNVTNVRDLKLTDSDTIYDKDDKELAIDFIDIDTYINHFEAVYIILETVRIDSIDELFQQRFFSFMLNPFIQKEELFECFSSDKNDFLLFRKWLCSIYTRKGNRNDEMVEYLNTYTCGSFEFLPLPEGEERRRLRYDRRVRRYLQNYVYYICDPHCRYGYYAFTDKQRDRKVMRLIRSAREDVQEILALQQEVTQELSVKEWFCPSTEAELCTALADPKQYLCLQVVDKRRIVAFAYVILRPDASHDLCEDLRREGLLNRTTAAVFETVFVHPAYRGYGIQDVLVDVLSEWSRECGAEALVATVHPDNTYSRKNFEQNGYKSLTDQPIEKYGSKRMYYAKTLSRRCRRDSKEYTVFPYV